MGTSTDGILAYGYDLGGPEEWKILESDEYEDLDCLAWYNEDDGFDESAMNRLLAAAGFTETDWKAPGYHERKKAAEERIGVGVETHCSNEAPMYLLVAKTHTAYRGRPKTFDVSDLTPDGEWDEKLAAALKALGMTPTQERAQWILCSYWG